MVQDFIHPQYGTESAKSCLLGWDSFDLTGSKWKEKIPMSLPLAGLFLHKRGCQNPANQRAPAKSGLKRSALDLPVEFTGSPRGVGVVGVAVCFATLFIGLLLVSLSAS